MKMAVHIKILIGYIKKGLLLLGLMLCVMLHADLHIAMEKPHLHNLDIDEAFDPLKFKTLHPDSAIYKYMYA